MSKTVERFLDAAGDLSGDRVDAVSILSSEPPAPRPGWPWPWIILSIVTLALIGEGRFSWLQSLTLSWLAADATYRVKPGPGNIPEVTGGPYDARLGYAQLNHFS